MAFAEGAAQPKELVSAKTLTALGFGGSGNNGYGCAADSDGGFWKWDKAFTQLTPASDCKTLTYDIESTNANLFPRFMGWRAVDGFGQLAGIDGDGWFWYRADQGDLAWRAPWPQYDFLRMTNINIPSAYGGPYVDVGDGDNGVLLARARNTGNVAAVAQLPQSGDPAASWRQQVTLLVGLSALVGAVVVYRSSRRQPI